MIKTGKRSKEKRYENRRRWLFGENRDRMRSREEGNRKERWLQERDVEVKGVEIEPNVFCSHSLISDLPIFSRMCTIFKQ